jgi:acyl carrier protein
VAILGDLVGRAVEPEEPLMDAGLDSLSGVELKSKLETEFGAELPETVVFDYPTAAALSAFILDQTTGGEGDGGEDDDESSDSSSEDEEAVRVMRRRRRGGKELSGRPHLAATAAARAVRVRVTGSSFVTPSPQRTGHAAAAAASGDSISHVPRERWDMHWFWDCYLGRGSLGTAVVNPFGGFIEHADHFDAALFGLSRAEAQVMDVQHRSLLEGLLHARSSSSLATRGADAMVWESAVDTNVKCNERGAFNQFSFFASQQINCFLLNEYIAATTRRAWAAAASTWASVPATTSSTTSSPWRRS